MGLKLLGRNIIGGGGGQIVSGSGTISRNYMGAIRMRAITDSPTLGNPSGTFYSWTLSKDIVQAVGGYVNLPENIGNRKTMKVTVKYYNSAGGSGNIVWNITVDGIRRSRSTFAYNMGETTISGGSQFNSYSFFSTITTDFENGDHVFVRIRRDATDGNDTYNQNANLVGVEMSFE